MLQTSGLFLSAHADRPVISTGTPHVTASQTNISAPRWRSRRQVPEKEKGPGHVAQASVRGQGEIRTRGGLPLNGFQDRLFRPLRHLPFAPNIAATHETPIYHSARKCDTWHSLHPRRFQQKTAHASAQNDTNGTGTVQHTKSGAGTNANAAFTDSYQTRTSWKIRLPTWSAR